LIKEPALVQEVILKRVAQIEPIPPFNGHSFYHLSHSIIPNQNFPTLVASLQWPLISVSMLVTVKVKVCISPSGPFCSCYGNCSPFMLDPYLMIDIYILALRFFFHFLISSYMFPGFS